jgi:hypothetical protein
VNLSHRDGTWYHGDARGSEPAVVHVPAALCPASGRHPESDCGLNGGCLRDRMPWWKDGTLA